jgi:hypothetical protein
MISLTGRSTPLRRMVGHGRTVARRVFSASAGVANDATDERRDPGDQPRQRVQMLVTSACGCGLPASRAWSCSLHPSDIEQKNANPGEEPKRGADDRRLGRHQPANHSDRRENENAERNEAERRRTSEQRPYPEPAAAGCVIASSQQQCDRSRRDGRRRRPRTERRTSRSRCCRRSCRVRSRPPRARSRGVSASMSMT